MRIRLLAPAFLSLLISTSGLSASSEREESRDSLLASAGLAAPREAGFSPEHRPPVQSSFWSRELMSGDWWGVRENMAATGIEIHALYRGDLFRSCAGGICPGSGSINNLDATLEVRGDGFLPWPGLRAFVHVLANDGGTISSLVGDAQMVSNLESPRTAKLYQLFLEQTFGDGGASLLVGMLDMNAEFYVTPSSGMFLNGSHGVGKELSQAGLNGPSVFPNTSVAFRVRVPITNRFYSQAAVFDGMPGTSDDPMASSFGWRSSEGCFAVAECGYMIEATEDDPAAKLAVGGWWYPRSVVNESANSGCYILAERQVIQGGVDGTEGLTLFLRAGLADAKVNRFSSHVGAGAVYSGLIPGREEDHVGVAVALASEADAHCLAHMEAGGVPSAGELNIEISYRCALTPWLVLQPDFQYVRFPDADRSVPDAKVLGTRLEFHL